MTHHLGVLKRVLQRLHWISCQLKDDVLMMSRIKFTVRTEYLSRL
jgi:hypothetical protein